jgi:hypothetical protein
MFRQVVERNGLTNRKRLITIEIAGIKRMEEFIMQETKPKETEKPLKLKKVSVRDLDEPSAKSSARQTSTIEGCNFTHETCLHHCNK